MEKKNHEWFFYQMEKCIIVEIDLKDRSKQSGKMSTKNVEK
jgi:hypothetical protein